MTSRAHFRFLLLSVVLLSGCQSVNDFLTGQASTQSRYTADELTALNDPQPAAARTASSTSIKQVSNSSTVDSAATPIAAGRVDQLIRSGEAAIREAGQGNPKKLQEARQIFEQVVAMEAGNASAHHGIAIAADLQQDWATAEHHYKLALQQRPQDVSLLNDLGYSYLLQNRFYESSQYLTQAIHLSPQHERAHINIALLSLKRGDRDAAQAQLAEIYSPAKINATLARLEQGLQQTAGNDTTMVAAAQPPGNHAPQQQLANHPQSQQPVHVFPPGVAPESPTQAPQHTAMLPHGPGNFPGQGSGGPVTPAVYPGQNPSTNTTMQSNMQHNGINAAYPTPVGGVIATPPAVGSQQYQSGGFPSATMPHALNFSPGGTNGSIPQMNNAPMNTAAYPAAQPLTGSGLPAVDQRAQIAGLNAGPGTLFPISAGGSGTAGNFAPNPQVPQPTYNYPVQPGQLPAMQTQPNYPGAVMNAPQDTRPISVLPGQEYRQHGQPQLNQQQQQQQKQLNQQQQQQQFSSTIPVSATQYRAPGTSSANGSGVYRGMQTPSTNGMQQPSGQYPAGSGGSSPNGLTAYEQQLRLNNQYNQTIQQMNGRGPALNAAPGQY